MGEGGLVADNFQIPIPAQSWVIPSSGGCSRGAVQNRIYLAFDDTAVEGAHSPQLQLPAAYTGSGTLKADILYAMASATANKVDFEVCVEAITAADAVDTDSATSYDAVNAGDQTVPATAGYLGKLTITLTNNDSCAAGDMIRLKLERDADDGTNDTATGDARVYCVVLREEV